MSLIIICSSCSTSVTRTCCMDEIHCWMLTADATVILHCRSWHIGEQTNGTHRSCRPKICWLPFFVGMLSLRAGQARCRPTLTGGRSIHFPICESCYQHAADTDGRTVTRRRHTSRRLTRVDLTARRWPLALCHRRLAAAAAAAAAVLFSLISEPLLRYSRH